jgi:molybdate transport system substrate-binding protein
MGNLGRLASLLALLACAPLAGAEEVLVFAAASLSDALEAIGRSFEKRTGQAVILGVGASSDLARQIKSGAPADVFFSADAAQMDGLVRRGFVRAADRVDLLSNSLVVVVPAGSSARVDKPADLAAFASLALADPEAVPAGVYARTWLQSVGLWPRLAKRAIPTLDVRAALAAVESESAEAGIVYKTDAALSRRVRAVFDVPRAQGPAITYPVAPLAASEKAATAAFVEYLRSEEARAVFRRFGFVVLGPE